MFHLKCFFKFEFWRFPSFGHCTIIWTNLSEQMSKVVHLTSEAASIGRDTEWNTGGLSGLSSSVHLQEQGARLLDRDKHGTDRVGVGLVISITFGIIITVITTTTIYRFVSI